jgi:hypothetical protein
MEEHPSEGEEGKLFVWTPDDIRKVLGDEADAFLATQGVTPETTLGRQPPATAVPCSPFTTCCGLQSCFAPSGGYAASPQPVAREHWEPASATS